MAEQLTVRTEVQGIAVVMHLDGDLDLLTAPKINAAVKAALRDQPRVLVVDLGGVGFLGSAGIAELVTGYRLAGSGTEFRVVASSRSTSRPLELVGLTEVLGVYPTLDDALAAPVEE